MKNGNIFVWLQTTSQRDSSRTTASIEKSDIGQNYTTVVDTAVRSFPEDYPGLQLWWENQMLAMAQKALENGCEWILRLEDDIVVNRYILHNIEKWRALHDPYFGVGLFFWPNYWHETPWAFKRSEHTGAAYKDSVDVEGAQSQLLKSSMVEQLIPLTRKARQQRGLNKPTDSVSFDWSISRAARNLGLSTHPGVAYLPFVHKPALVDIHNESLKSVIGATDSDPRFHYWGDEAFNPTWRK